MNAEAKTVVAPAAPTIKDDMAVLQAEVVKVLPKHIGEEKFMRVVATAIAMNPDLRAADRRSLYTATVKAATDGLLPDGREGVFAIYNTKQKDADGRDYWVKAVQWMPMTAGILKKVRNSGELKSITSNVVKKADHFKYWVDDDGEHVQHEPNILADDRGPTVAVYAIAKAMNGGVYTEVMSRGQIDQVRKVSKSADSGPWASWYDEMARKAVIRRLSKRLPMSTDLEVVIQRDDDHYDLDRPQAIKADGGVSAARAAVGLLSDSVSADPQPQGGELEVEPDAVAEATTEVASEQPGKASTTKSGRSKEQSL